jgi:hypothetical protein
LGAVKAGTLLRDYREINSESIWGHTSWKEKSFRLSNPNRNQIFFQTFKAARTLRPKCQHLIIIGWIPAGSVRIQKIRISHFPFKSSFQIRNCKVREFWLIIAAFWKGIILLFFGKKKKNWKIIFGNKHLGKKSNIFSLKENQMRIYLWLSLPGKLILIRKFWRRNRKPI